MRAYDQFDPALATAFYAAQSQTINCPQGSTRLCTPFPKRVFLRFAVDPAPVLLALDLTFGGANPLNVYAKLTAGTITELFWMYHGPLIAYDWWIINPGVAVIPVYVTEMYYNG